MGVGFAARPDSCGDASSDDGLLAVAAEQGTGDVVTAVVVFNHDGCAADFGC